jgi:hypothetical protein
MKIRATQLLILFALVALAGIISGCASEESDNASVRPWNAPAGWENGLSGMDTQHR